MVRSLARSPSALNEAPGVGRFAPSTTGHAHPGTLLAALLCWLDARSRGARILLRLEDLDPDRCRPEFAASIRDDLEWLGVDWDEVILQSDQRSDHEAALDQLAEAGTLYPCRCSRKDLRDHAERAPDGGHRYPGTCRGRSLPEDGWRKSSEPLRMWLPDIELSLRDESGLDLSQNPSAAFGDPVVRRRDGAIAYHLATVVDDASASVTRVVRGRDLATTTATQILIQQQLGLPTPNYRHHFLLMEQRGNKLAKLHGAVDTTLLRAAMSAPSLVGLLAQAATLRPTNTPTTPTEILQDFTWQRVTPNDQILTWTPPHLTLHRDR
ncbi:MAG: hypothetical protein GY723_22720 [bacterium]|nr:hypothetical protein [bacterium]